ncbi:MAG: DUF2156 domain-containing protein [Aquisalinus sp.]|nr:DUF2156 domain-containing protein [Aquisalinus sp.]
MFALKPAPLPDTHNLRVKDTFRRIDPVSDMRSLRQWLSGKQVADTYAISPAIMTLYGRHGLWAHSRDGASVLFYRDPDKPGVISILPQLGSLEHCLAADIVRQFPARAFELVRVPTENARATAQWVSRALRRECTVIEEPVRDYRYPVHIVSCRDIAALQGRKWRNIRQHCHAATRHAPYSVTPYEAVQDRQPMLDLYHAWAIARDDRTAPVDVVDDFADALCRLAGLPEAFMHGLVLRMRGEAVGYSFWETPLRGQAHVNAIAGFTAQGIRGLAELLEHETMKHLAARGIHTANIGGSETAGLDAFKRKFHPVQSVLLVSIRLSP